MLAAGAQAVCAPRGFCTRNTALGRQRRVHACSQRSSQDPGGLTLLGLCATSGLCSMDQVAAAAMVAEPGPEQRQRLARRLADSCGAAMQETAAMATALTQQQQQPAAQDAVWAVGRCAAHGDVWCLLQLALLCSEAAAVAATPSRRRQLHMSALRLLREAADAVSEAAAEWDVWVRGNASPALGSFVALCTSGGSPAEAAAQLEQVSALVTDAAAEEGGIELWALQDLLQRQEERLALARAAAACGRTLPA